MSDNNPMLALEISSEFKKKVAAFKTEWRNRYKKISNEKTPQLDGTGRRIIGKKGSYEYIISAYMVESLDKHFPGWSWEFTTPLQFLGSEWIVAQGTLIIIDEYLVAFGIYPPYRRYYGCGAVRITYPKGVAHEVGKILDINNNVKAANTEAMKVAINRLTHIGDDVYGKRIEEEGAGNIEDIALVSNDATTFGRWVAENNLTFGEIFKILEVDSAKEITNFTEAIKKIKQAKEWE